MWRRLQTLAPALHRAASTASGPASLDRAAPLSHLLSLKPLHVWVCSPCPAATHANLRTETVSWGHNTFLKTTVLGLGHRPMRHVLVTRSGGENSSYFGTPSRIFDEHKQSLVKGKRDFVHVLLKRNKTFVTTSGEQKDRGIPWLFGGQERTISAEHVGRAARKMGLKSVVMKVKGTAFFNKKKKVIVSFREGFRGERVREQSPVVFIHDVTQLPHNGCRLPKQCRV
uniref:Ribosomal protein S11 n=1 Tax=Oryza meridionalis TaxID=40149 RepID=A0A0E0C4K8_9ORYZ